MAKQRSVHSAPRWVRWLLPAMLLAQVAFRLAEPSPAAVAAQLGPPPAVNSLRLAALGEPIGLAVALALRLQAFDTQPGISIAFRELDYPNVVRWLDRIVMLDPLSAYPLLLASQVYSQVPDDAKQRIILDFVLEKFREDPVRRWRWLAHASIIAKHRLGDPQLALTYARAIASEANDPAVPAKSQKASNSPAVWRMISWAVCREWARGWCACGETRCPSREPTSSPSGPGPAPGTKTPF